MVEEDDEVYIACSLWDSPDVYQFPCREERCCECDVKLRMSLSSVPAMEEFNGKPICMNCMVIKSKADPGGVLAMHENQKQELGNLHPMLRKFAESIEGMPLSELRLEAFVDEPRSTS